MSEGRKRRRIKPAHKRYGNDAMGNAWSGYGRVEKRERREQEASDAYWKEVEQHADF